MEALQTFMKSHLPVLEQDQLFGFLETFREEGDGHLWLACHAAFPGALTPDLLYKIWLNFRTDEQGKSLNIPSTAVSDLLLSPIMKDIGLGMFEIPKNIRSALLAFLQSEESTFGPSRIRQLARFLKFYVRENPAKIPTPAFRETQEWTALAYLDPAAAAQQVMHAIRQPQEEDQAALLRIELFLDKVVDQQEVLRRNNQNGISILDTTRMYVKGLRQYAFGNLEGSIQSFRGIRNSLALSTLSGQGMATKIPMDVMEALDLDLSTLKEDSAATRIKKVQLSNNTDLNLAGLNLTEIPESVFDLVHLESLDLSYNQLGEIPVRLAGLTRLTSILLHHNSLVSFPPTLFELKQLEHLDLSYNKLQKIPGSIQRCTQLIRLNLRSNQIREVPLFLTNLAQLDQLQLQENPLQNIPSNIIEGDVSTLFDYLKQSNRLTTKGSLASKGFILGGNYESRPTIQEIPHNRTLMVVQLTDEPPIVPEMVYGLDRIEAVFRHFQPEKEIEFELMDGNTEVEILRFEKISDFSMISVIDQSSFLSNLNWDIDFYLKVIEINQTNQIFQKLLAQNEAAFALYSVFDLLSREVAAGADENKPNLDNIKQAVDKLRPFGGFKIITQLIKDTKNLDFRDPLRRQIYLTDSAYADRRKAIHKLLLNWMELLVFSSNVIESEDRQKASTTQQATYIIEVCNSRIKSNREALNYNLRIALSKIRRLEISYRSVDLFFRNAEMGVGSKKGKGYQRNTNLTLLDAGEEPITNLDSNLIFEAVKNELANEYHRSDMKNCYSLLVIPGFLSKKEIIQKYAELAKRNKVLLITDYRDLPQSESVKDFFAFQEIIGQESFWSNTIMTCNWLLARETEEGLEERLFLPPSAALAGKICANEIGQPAAGIKHGVIYGVNGVRFNPVVKEVNELDKLGLIPVIENFNNVQAMGVRTLFNGPDPSLQDYSSVRVMDWLSKTMINYMNRQVFQKFDGKIRMEIQRDLTNFLSKISKDSNIIQHFGKPQVEFNPEQPDKVHVKIEIKPYFAAKSYTITYESSQGELSGRTTSETENKDE